MLRRAIEEKDPDGVEFGLYLSGLFGPSPEHLDLLLELANADWHRSHELAVDYLSYFNAPVSAATFHRAALAQHPYRSWDDSESIGVKAIWALGRMRTQEAVRYLGDLARSGKLILEKNARAQLARIEAGGESEPLRQAARDLLQALPEQPK